MKFDGNLAWKHASAMMAGNRDLLLALAGVFFFLPSFALIMLFKQPQVPPGATREQMMALLEPFIASVLPWLIIGSLVQALGQLTLIELFGRRGRLTVGEALRHGLGALPSFIVVQLLIGFAISLVLFLAMGLGGVVSPILGLALGIYAICQLYGRFIAASAAIVLERQLNPFRALARAVALSRGHGLRIGNFLFLLAAAALFVFLVVTVIVGIVAALTLGQGRPAEILTGFVSSAATALVLAYFMAIIVAVYRQLAGEMPEAVGID